MLDPLAEALLLPRTLETLRRAHRALTFAVHMYATPEPVERLLVVLGEVHVKPRGDSEIGKQVIREFWLRGVEGFQRDKMFLGNLLALVIGIPRWLLCKLSFDWIRGSTITDARALTWGSTVRLERARKLGPALQLAGVYLIAMNLLALWATFGVLVVGDWLDLSVWHVTSYVIAIFDVQFFLLIPAFIWRKRKWAVVLHPLIAIVTVRDRIMADGTQAMLAEAPEPTAALVIMGLGHLSGCGDELVARGFRRLPFY